MRERASERRRERECVNCHFNGVLVKVLVIQTAVWHCFFYKPVRASDLPF